MNLWIPKKREICKQAPLLDRLTFQGLGNTLGNWLKHNLTPCQMPTTPHGNSSSTWHAFTNYSFTFYRNSVFELSHQGPKLRWGRVYLKQCQTTHDTRFSGGDCIGDCFRGWLLLLLPLGSGVLSGEEAKQRWGHLVKAEGDSEPAAWTMYVHKDLPVAPLCISLPRAGCLHSAHT